jgi:hypothetical protein
MPRTPANRRPRGGTEPALTARQLRAIQAQRRSLADRDLLSEDGYRAILAEHPQETDDGIDLATRGWPQYGRACTSASHLSRRQARQVITQLEILGAPIGRPYSGSRTAAAHAEATGNTPLATAAQLALISRLADEIQWRRNYAAWLHGRTSPTKGQPIRTFREAESVIEALHRMRDSQAAPHADASS